jgi:hypothetical protein
MGLMFPKPRPTALEREDRRKAIKSVDERESRKVKIRSGGRCEVVTRERCKRYAQHVHHMLGGIGVRGRGESAKAIRKQHVCADCHSDIGNHILVRLGRAVPRWTDRYQRLT